MSNVLRKKEKEEDLYPLPKSFESICDYYKEELSTTYLSIEESIKWTNLVNNLLMDPAKIRIALKQRTITNYATYRTYTKILDILNRAFNLNYEEVARQSIKDLPNPLEDQSIMAGSYINASNEIYGSGVEARTRYCRMMFEEYCESIARQYVLDNYRISNEDDVDRVVSILVTGAINDKIDRDIRIANGELIC